MSRYVGYKLNLDGWLDHKEHLDNIEEVNEWANRVDHNNMIIVGTKEFVYATKVGFDDELYYFKKPLGELEEFIKNYTGGRNTLQRGVI